MLEISNYSFSLTLLTEALAQAKPWVLIEWISIFLGVIINFIYSIVSAYPNALGISVILFTFVVRGLMFPLGINQQKSMVAMQKLTPEIEKIKKKYGTSKDPEVQQKIAADTQKLYAKHKVNPFGGCLPLILQMPIFFALIHIMQNTYYFIDRISDFYAQIYSALKTVPGYMDILIPVFQENTAKGVEIQLTTTKELGRILNVFTQADWTGLLAKFPKEISDTVWEILRQRDAAYMFFGLDMRANAGWGFPGILIPILTGVTMFLSSWIMQLQQNKTVDPQQQMTQKIMLIGMPIFMAWTTVNFPIGVGLYWIASSLFQLVQQMVLNRYFGAKKEA
ncbi:MAG: YidC/Oxa1 family membrane protein insertase [Clostridiales bacterium]|nr:YidC/Oxa1 family membrane protein insertase [Clostridiales bacterium]